MGEPPAAPLRGGGVACSGAVRGQSQGIKELAQPLLDAPGPAPF